MNKKINHVAAFQIRMHRKSKVSNNYGIIRFFSITKFILLALYHYRR